MDMLAMTYIIGTVIGIAFLIWLYTKSGNKEVIYGRFIDCAWWFWNVSLFLCYMVKYPERQKMAC